MRKFLSVFCILALLVTCLFVLAGCGNNSKLADAAGTYQGKYTKFVGDPDSAKVEDEPFSLELKANGTGTHNRDDLNLNVTWSLDGENFKMTETFMGMSIDYTGTLKDGKLNIFNGDPTDDLTCEYVYEK